MANVVIRPHLYQRYRSLVGAEPFVIVRGELQRRDGTTNVIAQDFKAGWTAGAESGQDKAVPKAKKLASARGGET